MNRPLVLAHLDWQRPGDPRTGLGVASIAAATRARAQAPRVISDPSPIDPAVQRRAEKLAADLQCALESALQTLFPTVGLTGLPCTIATLLAGVRRVELAWLPDDDKVSCAGDTLRIDLHYPELLCAPKRVQGLREKFFLYVAHEVAHLAQGIGAKRHVHELHAADGEETLLQIDLEADHAAAVFVRALTGTELTTLKEHSLAMLEAFPANIHHLPGPAQRKARRAVAIAADIAARRCGLVTTDDTFAYLHWTRGGGPAGLFLRGSFTRRASTFYVSPRDATTLDAAASRPRLSKKRLVPILERLIGTIRTDGNP